MAEILILISLFLVFGLVFVGAFIAGSYFGNRKQIIFVENNQSFKKISTNDIPTEQDIREQFEEYTSQYENDEPATIIDNDKEVETDRILKMFSEIDTKA